jgi:putative tryptophan/tyrosine transport system substrate-binding protein
VNVKWPEGGLVSYSKDFSEAGRISAKYVQRILTGTSPTDLPVERIDRLVFMINLKTAKEIGLTIPDSVLIRADKVIE